MRTLLLMLLLQAIGTPAQAPTVDVVVPAGAATGTIPNMEQLGGPKPNPNTGERSRTGPNPASFLEFLRPREPLRFVVDQYNPQIPPWGSPAPWTPDSIKAELHAMMTARMEGVYPQILWSEGTLWSLAATLAFKDGKQGKLLLDGLHGC
jgi:hypothetical protein